MATLWILSNGISFIGVRTGGERFLAPEVLLLSIVLAEISADE